MFHVRLTKTKSKSTAVQVVQYKNRKTVIFKHIGSTKDKEELFHLKTVAVNWIKQHNPQLELFPSNIQINQSKQSTTQEHPLSKVIVLNQAKLISTHSIFIYEILSKLTKSLGFSRLLDGFPERQFLLDLVITRLIHPASKIESIKFLEEEFDIKYERNNLYRSLVQWTPLKDEVEDIIVTFAKKNLDFSFNIIFYDVTTLYFESFKSDEELKQCGFSKDNKFNQPQIVIGLVVNNQGFPVSYEIFAGNKFEGDTFIPVLDRLQKKYYIKTLTVVADAAMISKKNVDELVDKNLNYIVGARLGSLAHKTINTISKSLNKQDLATTEILTERGILICAFSQKRYQKDKQDTEKQINRAKKTISDPKKNIKRLKFVTTANTKLTINKKLINKSKRLWGIKGYYTNLQGINHKDIIYQYHQLWNVEKSFRITKSDLQARPIYHRNTQTIQSHILICFMALSIAKYVEIKTGLSLNRVINILKTVKDAKIKNQLMNEIITMRSDPSTDVDNLLEKLDLSY